MQACVLRDIYHNDQWWLLAHQQGLHPLHVELAHRLQFYSNDECLISEPKSTVPIYSGVFDNRTFQWTHFHDGLDGSLCEIMLLIWEKTDFMYWTVLTWSIHSFTLISQAINKMVNILQPLLISAGVIYFIVNERNTRYSIDLMKTIIGYDLGKIGF